MDQNDQALIDNLKRFFVGRMFGLTYVYLTRPVFENLGMEGERALRQGLRAYGRYRGERMRRWHIEEGLPLNLESTILYWDVSSIETCGCSGPGMIVRPYHLEFPATTCPLHDVNREEKWEHYGYTYCDEIHQELWMAYDPTMFVEIHENLHKGDDQCWFRCRMEPGIPEDQIDRSAYDALQQRIKDNPLEYTRLYVTRDTKLNAILYYFLADAIIRRFEEDGVRLVRTAARELGRRRGRELRDRLRRDGLSFTWANVWDNFDLAYQYLWEMNILEQTPTRFEAEVTRCPFAEVWNELDNRQVGPLFCSQMYNGMFKAFGQDAVIDVSQSLASGDPACRFSFRL
jgi:hypothetical protein